MGIGGLIGGVLGLAAPYLAYFLISLHKIEIKGSKCIIYSDPKYAPDDDPIVVELE